MAARSDGPDVSRRVLHIITDLDRGGAEGVLLRLCIGLKEKGIESRVVSLKGMGPIGEDLKRHGVETMALGLPRFKSVVRLPKLIRWTLWADGLDGWLYHSLLVSSFLGLLFWRPVIWNVRGAMQDYDRERRKTKFTLFLARLLSWQPKTIAYNSNRARLNHERLGFSAKASILFNGFKMPDIGGPPNPSFRSRWRIPQGQKIVLTVGRYHRHKDYPTFCRAFMKLREKHPETVAMMVGKELGWAKPIFSDVVPESERMHFIFPGEQKELSDFYRNADLFVLSSMTESFPNVLGEAMAHQALCVSTDVGAARELLQDDELICRSLDPDDLCRVMDQALSLTPEDSERRRARNRKRMEDDFTLDKMIDAHRALYQKYF